MVFSCFCFLVVHEVDNSVGVDRYWASLGLVCRRLAAVSGECFADTRVVVFSYAGPSQWDCGLMIVGLLYLVVYVLLVVHEVDIST